jgi:hypothetical protein
MKWFPICLCVLAVAGWSIDSARANLVFNPSFEMDGGTPETADGWELFSAGGTVERSTDMPNTGMAHIHMEGDPLLGANFGVLVQRDLPVDPGLNYEMAFFAKAQAVDGGVGFRVEFYDDVGGLIGGMFDNNVFIDSLLTNEYQPFASTFTAPSNAATGTLVIFWELLDGFTSFDVDDVSFIPEPSSLVLVGAGGLALLQRRKRS